MHPRWFSIDYNLTNHVLGNFETREEALDAYMNLEPKHGAFIFQEGESINDEKGDTRDDLLVDVVTGICMIYDLDDPLIYTACVPHGASREDVEAKLLAVRRADADEDEESLPADEFRVSFVIKGNVRYEDLLFDNRS